MQAKRARYSWPPNPSPLSLSLSLSLPVSLQSLTNRSRLGVAEAVVRTTGGTNRGRRESFSREGRGGGEGDEEGDHASHLGIRY